MEDIKEVAPKVAREMGKECEFAGDILTLEPNAAEFATRLMAELQKEAEPVCHVRFWARQYYAGHGNIAHDEGLEVCREGEVGDDGMPAVPVFLRPAPKATFPEGRVDVPENIKSLASLCRDEYYKSHHNQTIYELANFICSLSAAPSLPARHGMPENLSEIIAGKAAEIEGSGVKLWAYQPTDVQRYQRLRILGAAPCGTPQLERGTVLRFQSLDAFLDADIAAHPSRGEADPSLPAKSEGEQK